MSVSEKKAFSLIELLIVILIIGLLYTLSVDNFKQIDKAGEPVSLKNLKEYMLKQDFNNTAEVKCTNSCLSCSLHIDSNQTTEIDSFVDNSVELYRYDFSFGMIPIEQEHKVCFSYKINKKGAGEQMFVKYKNKVYNFSNYFTPIKTYETLSQARKAQDETIQKIIR